MASLGAWENVILTKNNTYHRYILFSIIFSQRKKEAILFAMYVKACLHSIIFLFMRNLKEFFLLYKDKCYLRCSSVSLFGVILSIHGMKPDPRKLNALMEMPPPAPQKGIARIPWNNYLP